MPRITTQDLNKLIDTINSKTPAKIELSGAYGGYRVERSKCYTDFLNTGFISKPRLYDLLKAFTAGLSERVQP
jgi:hypothetical protein